MKEIYDAGNAKGIFFGEARLVFEAQALTVSSI